MRLAESKILELPALRDRLNERKARGERIIFANGCFDILHVGHFRFLEAARHEGDCLVVAINSDTSVRKLKGNGQPILSEMDRTRMVAALRCVDHVIIFSELNVESLMEELKPHVHAKGTDYTEDSVPERATAARLGVRVAIVGDSKDHSTRALLTRLRDHRDV